MVISLRKAATAGEMGEGGGTSGVNTVSSLHTNEFCSESPFPKSKYLA